MSKNTEVNMGGGWFLGLLTILFIGLKLTNYIAWSWLWVLSPMWLPLAVIIGAICLYGIGLLFVLAIKRLARV